MLPSAEKPWELVKMGNESDPILVISHLGIYVPRGKQTITNVRFLNFLQLELWISWLNSAGKL